MLWDVCLANKRRKGRQQERCISPIQGGLWKSRFFHSLMALSGWLYVSGRAPFVRLRRILGRHWGGETGAFRGPPRGLGWPNLVEGSSIPLFAIERQGVPRGCHSYKGPTYILGNIVRCLGDIKRQIVALFFIPCGTGIFGQVAAW